jgi:DNA invertase Pin-like site-specific DNA recombinase
MEGVLVPVDLASAVCGRRNRPELQQLLEQLRKNNVVAVGKLESLSRSLNGVLNFMEKINQAGAGFQNL